MAEPQENAVGSLTGGTLYRKSVCQQADSSPSEEFEDSWPFPTTPHSALVSPCASLRVLDPGGFSPQQRLCLASGRLHHMEE